MENHNKKLPSAYLRKLHFTHQCELVFHLNDTVDGVSINEEIKVLRQVTDTVGSMLQHIKNKLKKMVRSSFGHKLNEEDETIDISLWSDDNKRKIEDNVVLDKLFLNKVYIFCILRQKFMVLVNTPLVQIATLPSVMFTKSAIQPTKLKTLYSDKKYCIYEWYRSIDKENWEKVGGKFMYCSKATDLDHYLKFRCVPKSRNSSGIAYEVVSESTVKALPDVPKCPFEDRHKHTPTKLTDKEFRFVSYNILSFRYAVNNSQFPYCPNKFLAIDYRKQLLLKEISGYKADIICLQELDFREYRHFFQSKLKHLGYESIFHKKGFKMSEGMGCFYNSKKFSMIHSEQLVLGEELKRNAIFKRIKNSINFGAEITDIFLRTATSLQVTVLKSKLFDQRLIIGNTHLYYHPDASLTRVIQTAMITEFLNHLKQKLQKESEGRVSVILCGDFNSVPTSEAYYFLKNGKLENAHREKLKAIKNIENFTHSFHFESACGTPKYTNYTGDFKGCLDYIFYEKESIEALRYLPFFEEDVLSQNVALPNEVFPSDHLALVAELEFLYK